MRKTVMGRTGVGGVFRDAALGRLTLRKVGGVATGNENPAFDRTRLGESNGIRAWIINSPAGTTGIATRRFCCCCPRLDVGLSTTIPVTATMPNVCRHVVEAIPQFRGREPHPGRSVRVTYKTNLRHCFCTGIILGQVVAIVLTVGWKGSVNRQGGKRIAFDFPNPGGAAKEFPTQLVVGRCTRPNMGSHRPSAKRPLERQDGCCFSSLYRSLQGLRMCASSPVQTQSHQTRKGSLRRDGPRKSE